MLIVGTGLQSRALRQAWMVRDCCLDRRRRGELWRRRRRPGVLYIYYAVSIRSRKPSAKTQPFSIRLSEAADLLVREEGRRSGRSRSAVVQELAEEAAKARLFPGIAFRGSPRRAWVMGSGLDVWEIVELLGSYGDDVKNLHLNHPLVKDRHLRLARAYAARFPDEIEPFHEENRRPLEELRSLYPFLETAR